MASAREIRRRIRSVRNTAKITKAMEMVSASKMRRAQRNTQATQPYAERMRDVIGELTLRASAAAAHPLLMTERRSVGKLGLVLITPDRGLCGALVSNINRMASRFILERRQAGQTVEVLTVGRKGRDFAVRTRLPLVAELHGLGDSPSLIDTLAVATNVVDGFVEGRFDEVHVIYTAFVNTLVQRTQMRRLLPLEPVEAAPGVHVDYTYEPDQETVLNALLPRFVEVQLYAMILESIASEHSARMIAMRNATDNAKDLVRDLTLSANKARQAAITKELAEIAAGSLR